MSEDLIGTILGKEQLISALGYWPEFCDAKIVEVEFKPYDDPGASLSIVLRYIDMDKGLDMKVRIVLSTISRLDLDQLDLENVVDRIALVENTNHGVEFEIEACAGLSGSCTCGFAKIDVLSSQPYSMG